MDLMLELKKLSRNLDLAGIDYALCGGLAVAIYAKPRATLDIDIMIDPAFLEKTKTAAEALGFNLSGAPMVFKGGAVKMYRLTKIDDGTGEYLVLDILLVTPETQKAWDGRITVEWEGAPLHVVSPGGLILLKSLRDSGQDRDDIAYLKGLEIED